LKKTSVLAKGPAWPKKESPVGIGKRAPLQRRGGGARIRKVRLCEQAFGLKKEKSGPDFTKWRMLFLSVRGEKNRLPRAYETARPAKKKKKGKKTFYQRGKKGGESSFGGEIKKNPPKSKFFRREGESSGHKNVLRQLKKCRGISSMGVAAGRPQRRRGGGGHRSRKDPSGERGEHEQARPGSSIITNQKKNGKGLELEIRGEKKKETTHRRISSSAQFAGEPVGWREGGNNPVPKGWGFIFPPKKKKKEGLHGPAERKEC